MTDTWNVDLSRPIGDAVKAWRLHRGLTLQELASRLGTDKSYLSRLENGHIQNPGNDRLGHLAQALEVPVGHLVGRQLPADERPTPSRPETPPASAATGRRGLARPMLIAELPVRSIGQEIDVLLEEATLGDREEQFIAKHVLAVVREVLALVKDVRQGG